MKVKLKKFSVFVREILPHEADYLMSVHQFEDRQKLDILQRVQVNAHDQRQKTPFNLSIDKRKYSSLMQWMQKKLDDIDVDKFFEWINEMDRKVITDAISVEEERKLLRRIKHYRHPIHNFMKLYELAINFRHFLLIRLRYNEYKIVNHFVESYKEEYQRSKEVNHKLHEATVLLIDQFNKSGNSQEWEEWLLSCFNDSRLDGFNRYMSVVRLTFLYFNSREFDKLKDVYDQLHKLLSAGKFYTRRILYNYYANRLMLHSKFDVLQQAEEYGHLSIRQRNSDHIQYLSNFSAILIRRGKIEEALALLKESFSEVQKSNNFFHKIGFTSFYVKCLNLNNQPGRGELLAEGFMRIYSREILEQRWYSFFSAYIQSLIMQNKTDKVIKVFSKYGLIAKDEEDRNKDIYLPTIRWYYEIALLKEKRICEDELITSIVALSREHRADRHKSFILEKVFSELEVYVPRSIVRARAILHTKAQ